MIQVLHFSYNCNMNILITGANGFLGQHLSLYLANKGFKVVAVSRGEAKLPLQKNITYYSLELTDVSKLTAIFLQTTPSIVIHTAAMSKPDECAAHQDLCLLHNVRVTENLIALANQYGSFFMHISTDFIFGENGPHAEDAIPDPLNFYGESKKMAEAHVTANAQSFAIIRPVFIYGKLLHGMRPSFLHWVKHKLEAREKIKVVTDQLRTPTYVMDICKGIESILQQKKNGVFHLAGKDIISPYQMAIIVAKALKLDESLIEPVNSDTFPETVKRAKFSGLRIDKARLELGYEPVSFEEGVELSL